MIEPEGGRLLVVDDEPRNTKLLYEIFTSHGYEVLSLNDSLETTKAIENFDPDLIILDVLMPGLSGFDLTKMIKAHSDWEHIPIILLTALSDREFCHLGLKYGAEDYINKPFNHLELAARVKNLLKLKKLHDFQARNIRILEEYDQISGLPKRGMLLDFCESIMGRKACSHISLAFVETNLDDSVIGLRRSQGGSVHDLDSLICQSLVKKITQVFPHNIILGSVSTGRIGIVLEAQSRQMEEYLDALQMEMKAPILVGEKELFLSFHAGYTSVRNGVDDWNQFFNEAEVALIDAKKHANHRIQFYEPEMDSENYEKWWISQQLNNAISKNQLELHYQPQIDTHRSAPFAVEALLRWNHPDRGYIPPDHFIPIAEDTGQILEIGMWVIEESAKALAAWLEAGVSLRIAINISAVQFSDKKLVANLLNIVQNYGISPESFEIEITESCLLDSQFEYHLKKFRNFGFELSIDDFGTGYSNLENLKKHQFNRLKIDKSFVDNICTSEKDVTIVKSILAIAKCMGLKVIAEGVETQEQKDLLCELGCSEFQGYFFSKPLNVSLASEYLKTYCLSQEFRENQNNNQ